ncbi:uncharacterized protein LOC128958575 [Oppia nitens]|uniref:uncharacterized protein LOC128958575 n=1 Tax=Oppia nitens TaxID=1686743 RepID=UPI0023DCE808|nr:uncharacterized protein LOC128958575 [Oppia nitens]
MKFAFLLSIFVIQYLVYNQFNYVESRPSIHVTTRVCDSRQFLTLYQRTCTYYGKRNRNSNIIFHYGSYRVQRDISNQLDSDPAPELARKCCEEGCSVELIGLHCNREFKRK